MKTKRNLCELKGKTLLAYIQEVLISASLNKHKYNRLPCQNATNRRSARQSEQVRGIQTFRGKKLQHHTPEILTEPH